MMRRPSAAGVRSATACAVVAGALLAVAALVPGTAGAFTASITNADTAKVGSPFGCADTFRSIGLRDQAYFEYTLSEPATKATAADSSDAGNTGTYRQAATAHAVDASTPIACPSSPGSAVQLNGTDAWISTATKVPTAPNTFSLVLWLKSTNPTDQTKRGGFVMGLSQFQTAGDGQYDRFVYVGSDGLLRFGAYFNNANRTVATTAPIDDGAWHQVVVTVSATNGAVLYVDGAQKAADASIKGGQSYAGGGWWRIGWRDMTGSAWPSRPTPAFFAGSLRFAAAYPAVMSSEEVALEYRDGTPG